MLAGASLSALVAVPMVGGSSESGTALGSDEATVIATTAAGIGLGAWFVIRQQPEMRRSSVAIAPSFSRDGGRGVRVRVKF